MSDPKEPIQQVSLSERVAQVKENSELFKQQQAKKETDSNKGQSLER